LRDSVVVAFIYFFQNHFYFYIVFSVFKIFSVLVLVSVAYKSSAVAAEMGDRLATTDMSRKLAAVPPS